MRNSFIVIGFQNARFLIWVFGVEVAGQKTAALEECFCPLFLFLAYQGLHKDGRYRRPITIILTAAVRKRGIANGVECACECECVKEKQQQTDRQTDRHTDEWTYGGVVPGESVCVSVAATG